MGRDQRPDSGQASADQVAEADQLQEQLSSLTEEVALLRQKLQLAPKRVRTLEERLLETKGQLAAAVSQNEKLTYTLREAREHISSLRHEVEKLTQPPGAYGTVLCLNDDGTVDVFANGRKVRVAAHPELDAVDLTVGAEVVLNEALSIVMARHTDGSGEVVTLKQVLDGDRRALVQGRADEERVVDIAETLWGTRLRPGDALLMYPFMGKGREPVFSIGAVHEFRRS